MENPLLKGTRPLEYILLWTKNITLDFQGYVYDDNPQRNFPGVEAFSPE